MLTLPLRSADAPLVGSRRIVNLAGSIGSALELLMTWHERARQRRQLRTLSDHMLRDLGLGRADVELEATKPFWRP